MLIDTHCHLDFSAFDLDVQAVVDRALEHGIERIILPSTEYDSFARIDQMLNQYAFLRGALGFHPNYVPASAASDAMDLIRMKSSDPRIIAVGEIGLDYHWETIPHDIQFTWLSAQLTLASELGFPVILHSRNAVDDLLNLLSDWVKALPLELSGRAGVLHSFDGTREQAEKAIDMGFFIGLTGPITYKNNHRGKELATHLPLNRLLIETDAPFLPPHPYRGQRNEPSYVRFVAEQIAVLREIPVAIVHQQTSENALTLFGPALLG
jgi:TatD DNase family protein